MPWLHVKQNNCETISV